MELYAINKDGSTSEMLELSAPAKDICSSLAALYQMKGYVFPWIGYFAEENGQTVGTCAFKEPPADNRVEIAYFTFPENEGKGIATRMASSLIAIAKQHEPDITVFAQTLPKENASTAILRKLGFKHLGTVDHPEDGAVWEWEL
ncbi:MAG: GNAT family N-acetyltransferase [Anaerolineae bacterium]|nr:GNAT family N-acetyltransferase [Anaerolineae bacterium]